MSETEEERGFKVTDRRCEEREAPAPDLKVTADRSPSEERARSTAPIDFTTFIFSLSTSALVHLGAIEDPQSGKTNVDLTVAKQEIDLIEMLEHKTKGNLTKAEEGLFERVLYELRLRYVEAAKA